CQQSVREWSSQRLLQEMRGVPVEGIRRDLHARRKPVVDHPPVPRCDIRGVDVLRFNRIDEAQHGLYLPGVMDVQQERCAGNHTGDALKALSSSRDLQDRELPERGAVFIPLPANAAEDGFRTELSHAAAVINDPLVRWTTEAQVDVHPLRNEDERHARERPTHASPPLSGNSRSNSARTISAT